MLWLKELYFEIYLLFYEVTAPVNLSIDSPLCGCCSRISLNSRITYL